MKFGNRIFGIFFSPGQTTKALSEKPVWIDALIVILIAVALFSYFTLPFQSQDSYEMMRDNLRMKERLGEERFNQYLENVQNPKQSSIIFRSFVIVPISLLIFFLIQSLIVFGISRFVSTEGKYQQVLSVFMHGRMIDVVLGGGLQLFLVLTKKSFMDITMSPALFFPQLEVTSIPFAVLSQFNFFQIWAFAVIGLGLSHVLKIDVKKGLFLSYGFWLLKCLFHIGLAILGQQFMQ
jgi:hypothetical protein